MYYLKKIKTSKLLIATMATMLFFACLIISTVGDYTKFVQQQKSLDEQESVLFDFALDLSKDEKENILNDLMNDENISIMIPGSQIKFEPGTFSIGLFLNENLNYDMPMMEGRFFNIDDFKNNKKEVVIGKEILNSGIVTFKNGEKYIKRGIEEYKVIGIVGEKKKRTYFDYHLFYKTNNISIDDISNSTFSISSSKMIAHNIEEYLQKKSKDKNLFINISLREKNDMERDTISRAVGIGGLYLIFYASAGFCAFLTYILALVNYINNIKKEIIIRKTYGAKSIDLLEDMVTRYIVITFISLAIVIVMSYLTSLINVFNGGFIDFKNLNFIILFNCIVFIGILFSIISLIYINKFQPVEIIKEK